MSRLGHPYSLDLQRALTLDVLLSAAHGCLSGATCCLSPLLTIAGHRATKAALASTLEGASPQVIEKQEGPNLGKNQLEHTLLLWSERHSQKALLDVGLDLRF